MHARREHAGAALRLLKSTMAGVTEGRQSALTSAMRQGHAAVTVEWPDGRMRREWPLPTLQNDPSAAG